MAAKRKTEIASTSEKISDGKLRRQQNIIGHQFKPGQSGNPLGRNGWTPYAAAHRAVAAGLVKDLGIKRSDTVAMAVAKAVAKRALRGTIPAAQEAADRSEGKVRQSVNVEHMPGFVEEAAGAVTVTQTKIKIDHAGIGDVVRKIYGIPNSAAAPRTITIDHASTTEDNGNGNSSG